MIINSNLQSNKNIAKYLSQWILHFEFNMSFKNFSKNLSTYKMLLQKTASIIM